MSNSQRKNIRLTPDIDTVVERQKIAEAKNRYFMEMNGVSHEGRFLPCNDQKIADSVNCTNFQISCIGDDTVTLEVQGAGEEFLF